MAEVAERRVQALPRGLGQSLFPSPQSPSSPWNRGHKNPQIWPPGGVTGTLIVSPEEFPAKRPSPTLVSLLALLGRAGFSDSQLVVPRGGEGRGLWCLGRGRCHSWVSGSPEPSTWQGCAQGQILTPLEAQCFLSPG